MPTRRRQAGPEPWHLDRKIPIALIVAMVGQLVIAISWVKDVNASLDIFKSRLEHLTVNDRVKGKRLEDITVLQEELKWLRLDSERNGKKLERLQLNIERLLARGSSSETNN